VIQAPDSFRRKAFYAMEMLLRPLGLRPVDAGGTDYAAGAAYQGAEQRPGIWYAPEAPTVGEWLFIRLDPQTPKSITSSFRGKAPLLASGRAGRAPAAFAAGVPYLFPGGINDAGDPIASAFYWLSGCDYVANPERDRYGRVTGNGSLLDELGLVESAPVDAYGEGLASALREHGMLPREESDHSRWSLCPTFDIDYLRKWRPGILYREFVEYTLLGRGPAARWSRVAASLKDAIRPGDPYRTAVDRILSELDRASATGTFFFKGGATSAHDVAYSLRSGFVRSRMRTMQLGGHEIGLHPSFHAYNHPGYLSKEFSALARATGKQPVTVRTHYLRWDDLATPRHLHAQGFSADSTLGFPDRSGFRNGTCRPFQLWDHQADGVLDLWELPLAMMESSLFNREKLTTEEALARTRSLMKTAKRHGGVLVCLWHNVLWDEPDFEGWGEHFVDTLEAARIDGAEISSLAKALSRFR
jgi:hypothetical protein